MSYRIEICPNNRAGCKDRICKANNTKILKGELRLGTWVEIQDHGGFQWRHWGCVSGEQIHNIREKIGQDAHGEYKWDFIDGWEELEADPELKAKVQRVIKQGHIDPEDFNGDPSMNKLGQKGIHLKAPRKKKAAAKDDEDEDDEEAPAKKPAKRGRKKAADDEADEEPPAKKAKKSSAKKVATVEDEDSEAEAEVPVKKAKKVPVKKAAGKAKKEDAEPKAAKPRTNTRPARATKKAAPVEAESEEEEEEEKPEPPKKKAPVKRGPKKAAVVKEPEPEEDTASEPEMPAPKAKRGRKAKN
ncbi:hypothetical protein B0T19DRAFT_7934 [Cercophora scortea]|uniref:PARP-type domain-containing protein n=1 Tax=Cercophora scortea TaxID=314031 RepID=A0AAE0J2R8_9PEZI|nr:hypothetical protein B0T19DRAFT_7934 [Cercophora scortea]